MENNFNKFFNFYDEIPFTDNLKDFIHKSETVHFCVKTYRDIAIFTSKRILIIDSQGITGKKTEYYTIPLKNIVVYSIETAGTFDLDSEIKLTMNGGINLELKFAKTKNMNKLLFKVYNLITDYVIVE